MLEDRVCKCGKVFHPVRKDQFACSKRCRNYYYLVDWYNKHPNYSTLYSRKWRTTHPDKARAYNRKKYYKHTRMKWLNGLMEHIDEVKFSKVEVISIVMTTMIEKEVKQVTQSVKVEPVKKVVEQKSDTETMRFGRITVKLYKQEDGTYFWKGFLDGRFVIAATKTFADPYIAKKDIRSCFL